MFSINIRRALTNDDDDTILGFYFHIHERHYMKIFVESGLDHEWFVYIDGEKQEIIDTDYDGIMYFIYIKPTNKTIHTIKEVSLTLSMNYIPYATHRTCGKTKSAEKMQDEMLMHEQIRQATEIWYPLPGEGYMLIDKDCDNPNCFEDLLYSARHY